MTDKTPEADIRFVIEKISGTCIIQDFSIDILLSASVFREKYSLSFWDSILVASASAAKCNILISEDMQDGQKINEVMIKIYSTDSKRLKRSKWRDLTF
jgi:predicted nucleic acid-binding protein